MPGLSKSKVFTILSSAFIAGVFGASFYYPGVIDREFIYLLFVAAIIVLAVFQESKRVILIGAAFLFFTLGIFLTSAKLIAIKNINQAGQNFSGLAEVVDDPAIQGQTQKMTVAPLDLPGEKFSLTTGYYPDYHYGDELAVQCKLEIPKNFDGFDYQMFLAKDGVYYQCQYPKIKSTGKNIGNKFFVAVIAVKNNFNATIMRLMPSPQSGLLSGLLIGGSGLMSKTYQNYFSLTGTTHIVAVSGYNVTIVAEYLMLLGIFIGLWRGQAFWFAAIGIALFVILTGLPASAVRAGVMGILLIWAMKNGRLANAQNAILFAAVVMLLINPLLLRWDVGFQLSFLATLGIVFVYPVFNVFVVKKIGRNLSVITETLFLTLSAQAFVLPILMTNFGKLSLVSPLANVLVLPIIPFTMLLGFAAILFSLVVPPVGQIIAWLAFLPLKYEMTAIQFLAGLKYAAVDINSFPWWGIAGWYIMLLLVIYKLKIKCPPEK
ncbi:MAG: ComEC/Rec2 family competence protein [Candidatus Pacebacteria bacterium]|nr:ComEC/Rec2 family competence protein [Candidatus Paceibacterota bacterium]MDR3583094.1 ComEC/Rec2 family competence protein [Candidatus Paceibacterota bacterium]